MTILLNSGTLWSTACFYDEDTLIPHPEILHLNSIEVSMSFIKNKLGFPIRMENPGMFSEDIVTVTEDVFMEFPEFWVNAMSLSPYIINCNNLPKYRSKTEYLKLNAISGRNSSINFMDNHEDVEKYLATVNM